jgi:hypothetical protein
LTPSEDTHESFNRIAQVVTQRYHATAGKTLRDAYNLDNAFLETEADADFAYRNREKILAVMADAQSFERLLDLFVNEAIAFTYASNQFIQIDALEEAAFRRIYSGYLREMQRVLAKNETRPALADALRALVTVHFHELRANLTRFFDRETGEVAEANVILQKVTCAEYSPELQLNILGVALVDLKPPVLDLGCGKTGELVRYLNRAGISAVGVDRVVEARPELVQADWLELPLEPGRWGTIISHMAFSHHFTFHHLYKHGRVEPYARQYMALLNALQAGGSFYYAPGLPFIEAYLPVEKYAVHRHTVRGSEGSYSMRVRRLD